MSDDESIKYNIQIITNDSKKAKIEESDKPVETYILIQNEELSNQNKQLIIDMKNLEQEKNEIDECLDKTERDKLHMRNFMKSLRHINSLYVSIYSTSYDTIKTQDNVMGVFSFCSIFQLFLMFLGLDYIILSFSIIIFLGLISILYKDIFKKKDKLNRYISNVTETEKSNDYLNDYIDNM